MDPTVNIEQVRLYLQDTRDVAKAAVGPRVTVPLADGRVPDKVIGKVEFFYFRKRGWVPKSIPLKEMHQGKDAQEGFLHWMALRCYQTVGGVFRFLIWQSIQQFRLADEEITNLYQRKREWLNPLIIKNPGDERFNTAQRIFLKRRDLFESLKKDAAYKCATGVAIVAALVFLGLGALTYQPFFFHASVLLGVGALVGISYFSFRKADPFLAHAKEILALKVTFGEEEMSRSPSVSESPPPSYDQLPHGNPNAPQAQQQKPQAPSQPQPPQFQGQQPVVLGGFTPPTSDSNLSGWSFANE